MPHELQVSEAFPGPKGCLPILLCSTAPSQSSKPLSSLTCYGVVLSSLQTVSPQREGSGSQSSLHAHTQCMAWRRVSQCDYLWKEGSEGRRDAKALFFPVFQLLLTESRSGDKAPGFYTKFDLLPCLIATASSPVSLSHRLICQCPPLPRAAAPPGLPCCTAHSSQALPCQSHSQEGPGLSKNSLTRPLALTE